MDGNSVDCAGLTDLRAVSPLNMAAMAMEELVSQSVCNVVSVIRLNSIIHFRGKMKTKG